MVLNWAVLTLGFPFSVVTGKQQLSVANQIRHLEFAALKMNFQLVFLADSE
jgi:hypothetical protein